MLVDLVCEECGGPFQRKRNKPTEGRGKYCSMACRARACTTKHSHSWAGGMSRTYRSWALMKDRCTNPNCGHFHHYGGRGIDFDPRWRSFETFLAEMGERPEGRSL